jgi:hypothetical protein
MPLGIDRRVSSAVFDCLRRVDDVRACRFGDRVVFVDDVEIDDTPIVAAPASRGDCMLRSRAPDYADTRCAVGGKHVFDG